MGILEGDHIITGVVTLESTQDMVSVDIPLKLHFLQKILATLDAFGQKNIASCCDGDDMGVLAEWLE